MGMELLSVLEMEKQQQNIYLKNKTRIYAENPIWYETIDKFIQNKEKALVVTGESGMGKSALLANWIVYRQNKKIKNEKIIYHFTGLSQSGGDYNKITQRLIVEIYEIYKFSISEKSTKDEENKKEKLKDKLNNLFAEIPKNEKLIIVLGSLDCLLEVDNAKMLNWIPEYPDNIKIIYSSLQGDKSMEALIRRGYNYLVVDALSQEIRKKIVTKYFKMFNMKLNEDQVEKITKDIKCENPLVLLTKLDDLRIFCNSDNFDKKIEEYLSVESNESLFELLLQNIEAAFSENKKNKKNFVKDILSLIAVSRYGLTEKEIISMTKITKLIWTKFFNSMSGHLFLINGFVTINNSIMLNAVKNRYLKDNLSEQPYRKMISTYMETDDDIWYVRKNEELPFQLMELKDWDKLYNFLLDKNVFYDIYERVEYELGKYWRALRETDVNRYPMEKYLKLEPAGNEEDKQLFYYYIAMFCNEILSDYSLGIKFSFKCIEINKKLYGEESDQLTSVYNLIGRSFDALGEYEKALLFYENGLAIKQKIFGKDHSQTATYYNNIGSCYEELGDFKKALNYLIHALEIEEKILNKESPEIATYYNNIGSCYSAMGDYQKALEYHNTSRLIREKINGIEHPDTALAYNNIAFCYDFLGEYDKELEYFLNALAIFEKFFGQEHFYTVTSYNNIGECYRALEDYDNALSYQNKALTLKEKIYGKEHPDIATAFNNIGLCYDSMGDSDKALEFHNRALEMRKKILGDEHPETSDSYCNIGSAYYSLGDYDEAIKYYNLALEIDQKNYGNGHPNPAKSYNFIGNCYFSMGEFEKAIDNHTNALTIQNQIFEREHYETANSYNNIGECYDYLGEYEKSFDFHVKALEIREKVYGSEHHSVASSCHNIAVCYDSFGNLEKALEFDSKALEIRLKVLGSEHLDTAISYNNIGYSNYHLGNYEKALENHLIALEIKKKLYDGKEEDLGISFNKVGKDYEALGKNEDALKNYNEALAILESIEGMEEKVSEIKEAIERLLDKK